MVKYLAVKLTQKHKTHDPYKLAEHENITILFEQLGSTLGYFNTYKHRRVIHINIWVSKEMQRFICAHELGHAKMHPKISTPFLKQNTFYSVDRIEREANQFAVELLVPDELVFRCRNLSTAFAVGGVPKELIYLKNL